MAKTVETSPTQPKRKREEEGREGEGRREALHPATPCLLLVPQFRKIYSFQFPYFLMMTRLHPATSYKIIYNLHVIVSLKIVE